jgi:hypothetical protein
MCGKTIFLLLYNKRIWFGTERRQFELKVNILAELLFNSSRTAVLNMHPGFYNAPSHKNCCSTSVEQRIWFQGRTKKLNHSPLTHAVNGPFTLTVIMLFEHTCFPNVIIAQFLFGRNVYFRVFCT